VVAAIATASIHDGSDRRWITAGALLLAVSGGLWLRLWLAWFVLTAVAAGDLVVALVTWPAWWWSAVLVNGAMLALLLARPTRRYARRGRPHLRGLFRRKS
jgi:membrane protein implicated in regulation of membrane protease activity